MSTHASVGPLQTTPDRLAGVARAVLAACLAAGSGSAMADANWALDPKISLSAEYDDNNRMSNQPGTEIEVTGAKVDAELGMTASTPRTTFRLRPRLRSSFYPGDETEEADDQFLRMDLRHEGQRADASFETDYSRVVTLGSYFPSTAVDDGGGLGDPDPGTSIGEGDPRNREDRLRIAPDVSFEVTQRQQIELGAEYLKVDYDREEPGERVGYSDISASAGYRFRTSQTADVGIVVGYGQYEPDDGDSSDSYSVNGEWRNKPSETAEVYFRAGSNFVESTGADGSSDWSSGFNGGAGVRWAFEVTDIFLEANQYLDPNASGRLVTRTQLRMQLSRKLGPMTTVSFGARGIDDSGAPGDDGYRGRQFASADVGLRWRMTRHLTLFGQYRYRWKEQEDAVNDAVSNALSLGITWEPMRQ